MGHGGDPVKWFRGIREWWTSVFAQREDRQQGDSQGDGQASVEQADLTTPPPLQAAEDLSPFSPEVKENLAASGIFNAGWITDVGQVRDHNEDGLFVFISEQQSNEALPPFGLFVLADGMGGHQAGEAASALASRVVTEHLISKVYLSLLGGAQRLSTQPSLTEVVAEAVSLANRAVNRSLPGSGTTLTCGMVLGSRLFVGHVGDSRAYLRRAAGEIRLLTHDHSMVGKLVEIGQLTPEEAAVHPQRNMLYRAVGQGGALDVDVVTYALHKNDQLLLCSDGLWGVLSDERIWQIIEAAPSPSIGCARLVEAANEAGGNDNITVILVEIQGNLL